MRFTKLKLLCLALFLFLVGCAGAGKKDEAEPIETAAEGELDPASEANLEAPFIAIPKPSTPNVSIPQRAREEFALAKQLMLKKDWDAAAGRLLLMTETYPHLAGVYVNLGIAYANQGKLDEAENAYRFAIEKNPLNFDAYTNLGVVLRNQGKFDQAEQVYLEALALWPHHQASLINLGVLYDMYMGKLPEALDYFVTAQKLNEEEDRTLKGWIIDLERRLPK